MIKKLFISVACFFLLSITLVLTTPKAVALNIPKPLKHDGLSFLMPLPDGLTYKYLTVTQGPYQTIDFAPLKKENVKETIAEPTITLIPISQVSNISIVEEPVTEETPTPTPSPTPQTPAAKSTTQITISTAGSGSNTSTGGGLNADVLFSMSNSYRTSHGLVAFQKDERVCSLAAQRAPEIGAEISEGHMHSGKNSHNFPFWFTENIISMNSEAAAFNWWINDPIHHDAIVGNYTNSCVACSGNSCVQEFTNFQGK